MHRSPLPAMTFPDNMNTLGAWSLRVAIGIAIAAALQLTPSSVFAQGQSDGTWTGSDYVNGDINVIALQTDGKVLVAGNFTTCYGQPRTRIARLNADGSFDPSFDPGVGPSGPIRDIIVRPDGKILVAGEFSFFSGANANSIALLNADGNLDANFNTAGARYELASQGVYEAAVIYDMALDPLGRILIAGYFNKVQGVGAVGIARFQSNGNVDPGFDTPPNFSWDVTPTVVAPGSNYTVLVGGFFQEVHGETHRRLMRFNYDATIDASFNASGNGVDANVTEAYFAEVKFILSRPDGSIWITGDFAQYNGTPRPNLALLHEDGSLDNSFSGGTGPDGPVNVLAVEMNGDIMVAGDFDHIHGTERHGLARMYDFGGIDVSFSQGSPPYDEMMLQPDGKVLAVVPGGNEVHRICPSAMSTWYADPDGDGLGSPSAPIQSCGHPVGYVSDNSDNCPSIAGLIGDACNDNNAATLGDAISASCTCVGTSAVSSFPWQADFSTGTGGFATIAGPFNSWYRGSLTGDPAPSMYISSGPTSWYYTFYQPAVSHLVRDLQWPSTISKLTLDLDRMGMGVPGSDYMKIWLVPDSYSPVAGQPITATGSGLTARLDLSGELTGAATWVHHNYELPTIYAGHTVRLVFEWRNDNTGGLAPPAAIDNISVCPTWFVDADGDGFGDPLQPIASCAATVPGSVTNDLDDCPAVPGRSNSPCNDGNASTLNDQIGLDCSCHGTGLPWNEDFGNGNGGFSVVQNGQTNQWYWGPVTGITQPSWYISGTGGATHFVANGPPSVSHLLHDLPPLPGDASKIQFTFDRFRQSTPASNHLRIWLVPNSFTPVAGTAITASGTAPNGRVLLVDFAASVTVSDWIQAPTYDLPLAYRGASLRVIFEWQDAGNLSTSTRGTGIDNIHLCTTGPGYGDADADGTADCLDVCPNSIHTNGEACDDGDPATINDAYANCVCTGVTLFTEGRLVVLQAGPAGYSNNTGKAVQLLEINQAGQISYTNEVPEGGANRLIVRTAVEDGMLGLSADSTRLVFAGYDANLFGAVDLATTSAASVPRLVGTVDAGGTLTRTTSGFFSGTSIRGAAAKGNDRWAIGQSTGLNYFGAGTPVNVTNGKSDLRAAAVFNGQLYVSSGSTTGSPTNPGVFAVGTGAPTTAGQTLTTLVNTGLTGTSAFCFSPDGNTLYVATNLGGIQKWVRTGTWQLAYTLSFSEGANGLVADFSQNPRILYFTTTAGDKLMKVTDPGTGTGSVPVTATLVRNANVVGTVFRGLSWAPKHACVTHTYYADNEGDGLGDPTSSISWCGTPPSGYVADNTDDCPLMAGKTGSVCDDGNAMSFNDRITGCVCAGEGVFGNGNIVLLQAGTGTGALASSGNPILLRGFTTAGVAGAAITIPSTGSNAMIVAGTAGSEGNLCRSADGTKLTFAGYAQALPNSTALAGTTSAAVNRAIGTVDAAGNFAREAVSSGFFSAVSIRGAASNGANFWASGAAEGVNYFGLGTPANISSAKTNLRAMGVFNGQLYYATSSFGGIPAFPGVYAVGTGTPTGTGQALTMVVNSNSTTTNGFYFKPTGTVLYVTIGTGGIQKWVNAGTWSLAYTMTFTDGANNLVADFSGANPVLYVLSNNGSTLLKITDPNTGSGSVAVTPVVLATAPANTAWRGIAYAPSVCPPTSWYGDTDGDGFGDPTVPINLCGAPPPGYVMDHTDNCPLVPGKVGSTCDDANSATINDVRQGDCTCAGTVPSLTARVFLQGPYDQTSGLMSDALRSLAGFPLSEPYTAIGLAPTVGATTIAASVLTSSGNDAIVDWVLVELRSGAAPASIVQRRCALVQRDGDVVDLDGISPVTFPGAGSNYYVAIRQRNHLGAMTATPTTFGATPLVVNFTSAALSTWGTNARVAVGTVMALYMGDSNATGSVTYTGTNNDRDPILVTVGSTTPNNVVSGYLGTDVNMSGSVKYTGSGNDRDPILTTVGSTTPNNTRTQQLP